MAGTILAEKTMRALVVSDLAPDYGGTAGGRGGYQFS